jgi:hypothetical protein
MSSKTLAKLAVAALLAIVLAACGSSKSSAVQAGHSAVAGVTGNATVQQDLSTTENALWSNFQKNYHPGAHPYKNAKVAAKAAVQATFPNGNTAAIEQYAISTFKIGYVHDKAGRDAWLQKVVLYAQANPAVPGTTPSPATTGSSK